MGYLSENDYFDTVDAARVIGITTRTFQRLGLSPVHKEGAAKFYSVDDVLELRDGRKLAKVRSEWETSRPVYDEDGDLIDEQAERKRKLRPERIWQEIRNKQATGELVETSVSQAVVVTLQGAMNAVL